MVLVHSSPKSLLRDHGRHPNLGVLASPRCVYGDDIQTWSWAADNDAYLAWDAGRYRAMLERIRERIGLMWVTAPDVVGDWKATGRRYDEWASELSGLPVAYVAQDGLQGQHVPWRHIAALFIGGTTEWKLGEQAARLIREAEQRGKWVHMGRVNTRRRVVYAKAVGCDSIDGTNFSMFRRTNLPWALALCGGPTQLAFGGVS